MSTTVYNVDCMEYMKTVPDKYFDLAIVDPPYGIGAGGGYMGIDRLAKNKDYKVFFGEDKATPPQEYFDQLARVSKNQIIWGANYMMTKIKADSPAWVVWDKKNGSNPFADCELAFTSFKGAIRKFEFRWQGMLQENMKDKEKRIHPTQKPVALYKWLLSKYAKQGDKILDTHVGSGSSRIACDEMGFDFVGCEIDKVYFDLQEKRFADWKKGAGSQLQFDF